MDSDSEIPASSKVSWSSNFRSFKITSWRCDVFFFEQKSWLERVDTLKSQSAAKESFETKNIILNVSIIISVKLNTWKLNNRFFEFAVCTNQCLVSTLLNFLRISSSQCRWLEFFLVAQTDRKSYGHHHLRVWYYNVLFSAFWTMYK